MKKRVLVLEGGGMRSIFTAGVLDAYLERGITFDAIYAISAGATAAKSFLSGQSGRNKRVFADYVNDPQYKGWRYLLTTGAYFNKEFIFKTIPDELDPFDYAAFKANPTPLWIVLTNCVTGETEYIKAPDNKEDLRSVLDAATSLPVMSIPVKYKGQVYLDGGINVPIVYDKVIDSDYDEIVYVLTQKRGYVKGKEKFLPLIRILLAKYPKIIKAVSKRHHNYNETLAAINQLDGNGRVTVLRPSDDFAVERVDLNRDNILKGFQDGYNQGMAQKFDE